MSTNQHTENSYEQTLIQLFQEMGYEYECGYADVTVYNDGICECNGCGFIWRI